MQIAFCIFKYFPFGGIQRDMLKMVRECLARGHVVRIYAIRWQAEPPPGAELCLVEVSAFTNHRLYERFAQWVQSDLRARPVDLVVGMNKMPGLDVYYAGDSCYQEKALSQRSVWYRLLPRCRSFIAAERAVFDANSPTEILTISDVQTPLFRRYYGTPRERFHPLPPGIDRDRGAPENKELLRAAFRAELGIDHDEHLLLFVGSGFIKKGLDRALRALQAMPPEIYRRTWLYVLGEDNAEPFRRMAKRLGVYQRVKFLGGRTDVPSFLFAGDGLLLPAYDENAGMAILEAMIAGLPALVTKNCGYAHYLERADAGMISQLPFDQSTFDRQVVELLTSEARADWIRNGRAIAADDSIYRLVPAAVDLLERFANRPPLIAFCLFKYFPYGGLQRDFLKVAEECVKRGYRVRVYALSWQGPVPEGMDVVKVPVWEVTNHRTYRSFARWVQNDLSRRRVAAVVGFNKMPGLDVYYAADSCYEEKAQTLRVPLYRSTSRYRLFSAFERAVFDSEAHTTVLLITDRQRQEFQQHYQTPAARFRQLPPGLGGDRKRPPDAAALRTSLRRDFSLDDDEYLLLLIGSGFITKGLDRALRALAALPSEIGQRTRLFVIGQDNPKQFSRLAKELGVADRLTLFAGRDDVPRFLQGADLLIHPAYMESGGIVLLEAVIAGLPVVTTDVCGFAPYILDAEAGVVIASPFSQEQLNAAVRSGLEDTAQRARWATNGVAYGQRETLFEMPARAVDFIEERMRA
jgi:UDP-glucose:(heptosyl)LPS alpha-1,3-glucosyltransferase